MSHNNRASIPLIETGPSSGRDSARLWLYAVTQWRRVFGLNVSQIDDLLFVGGEFSPAQWLALYGLGIRAVLSLQAEREDQFAGLAPARALRLSVEDFQPPSLEQLHAAVDFIAACREERLPVLVHCHAGVGRASLTASAYLMTQGLSHVQAFHHVKRARPIVALNSQQLARLVEWEWQLRSVPHPSAAALDAHSVAHLPDTQDLAS